MPNPKSNTEIEIKLPVRNLASLRRRLKQLRARQIVPRTYELNTLYDTAAQSLRHRGSMIRLRIEHRGLASANRNRNTGPAILTYKGPAKSSGAPRKSSGRFKQKEELELEIPDAQSMERILAALSFRPAFRYAKFRTTYTLPRIKALKVELDETPIGIFLELEGSRTSIHRAARLLGYSLAHYNTESYGSLYLREMRRLGRKSGDMLFSPTKKTL